MGCLAGQLISHFKKDIGGFYLYPSGTRDCGEEYIYTIYQKKDHALHPNALFLKVQAGAVTFFGLPGTKQSNMPVIYDGPVEDFEPANVQASWNGRMEEPPNDFIDGQFHSSGTHTADEDSTVAEKRRHQTQESN